jgi:hypothetical protein
MARPDRPRAGPPIAQAAPVAQERRPPDRLPAKAASLGASVAGPCETEAEARELRGVRDVYDAAQRSGRPGVVAEAANHALLCTALDGAGVDLGQFDHAIALWLARWEPHVVAVIASWVTRAGARP